MKPYIKLFKYSIHSYTNVSTQEDYYVYYKNKHVSNSFFVAFKYWLQDTSVNKK